MFHIQSPCEKKKLIFFPRIAHIHLRQNKIITVLIIIIIINESFFVHNYIILIHQILYTKNFHFYYKFDFLYFIRLLLNLLQIRITQQI